VEHQVENTKSTKTKGGIPIFEPYVPIKANPKYEDKQRFICFNCKLDEPSRHYYQQFQLLCRCIQCVSLPPHWGNNCP